MVRRHREILQVYQTREMYPQGLDMCEAFLMLTAFAPYSILVLWTYRSYTEHYEEQDTEYYEEQQAAFLAA